MARAAGKDRGILQRKGRSGWWVRIYDNGQQRFIKCDTKSQAKAVYARMKVEQREGRLLSRAQTQVKRVLLKDYVETWLANQPLKGKKISTIETYACRIRKHILPAFGHFPLPAITRPHLKDWTRTLIGMGLDYDTVLNVFLTLSGVLTEAVEDRLILVNPALHAGKLLQRPRTIEEAEMPIFTPEEERASLETIRSERPLFYPMALTFFRTGMRAGEVLGLRREDLNFRDRCIHLRRNWSRGRLLTPKNGKARRVDMSLGLAAVLKDWITLQDLEAAAVGLPSPEILFPGNIGGTRLEPYYMAENWLRYQLWFPLLKKAQVRRLDLHAVRHTFASRLIANGENLKYVSEQLGHSSIKVTADTYGHLIPGGNKQAVDRLDWDLQKNGNGTVTKTVTSSEEEL